MRKPHASFVGLAIAVTTLCAGLCVRFDQSAAAQATSPLPFDLPSTALLRASSHTVFAHYMTTFPISIDNRDPAADYYQNQYLNPLGENGKHVAYGGLVRERPLTRPVIAGDEWQLADMQTDVRRAVTAGIDGFSMDILGLSGASWERLTIMLEAARLEDPGFRIMLMPDASVGSVVADPDVLAGQIASIASSPSLYRLADGRLVISPFSAEAKSPAWWQTFLSTLSSRYGIAVAFVPVFVNYQANADAFSSISYGFSKWGGRSPASSQTPSSLIADVHAHGKVWMQPVAVQDTRPRSGVYDEANNSETLRATWMAAISGGADWVQLATWNDYSETSEIAPSTHIGWGPLDISSYYLAWFKLGSAPVITRDVVYISHRQQFTGAPVTGGQTDLMDLRPGSSPARDAVEVLTFVVAPAALTVKVGPNTYNSVAPAGVTAQLYPLAAGAISAAIDYPNGQHLSVVSPSAVVTAPAVQDLQYRFADSGRDGIVLAGATTSVPAPSITATTPATSTTTATTSTTAPTTTTTTTTQSTTTPIVPSSPTTTSIPQPGGKPATTVEVATGLPPVPLR